MYGPDAYGSHGICPLCNWQDCPVQLANPLDAGGPNRESLIVYQARAVEHWPLEIRSVVEEGDTYIRDSRWRPLSAAEVAYFRSRTNDGNQLTFRAIYKVEECYWMARSLPEPAPPRRIQYEKLHVIGPASIDGRYYRVIEYGILGGGSGLTSQMWSGERWLPANEGPGCPRIMTAEPASRDELIKAGVDCSPLGENYDPFSVHPDDGYFYRLITAPRC